MLESSRKAQLYSIIPYLKKYKKSILLGFVFILLTNAIGIFEPYVLKQAIDALQGEITSKRLFLFGLAILGVVIAEGFFLYLTRQTLIVMSRFIEYDLRNDFLQHLQKMSQRFFHKFSTGDLMARATNDLNAVRSLVGPGIMYSSNTIILFIGATTMMLLLSPALTMYALIPFPIMVLVVYKLMGKVHDIFKEAQEQFSKITTHAQENISGIRVVKAYVQEEREKRYFDQLNQGYIEINLRLVKIRGILWASMSFFSGTGVLLILWIGGRAFLRRARASGAGFAGDWRRQPAVARRTDEPSRYPQPRAARGSDQRVAGGHRDGLARPVRARPDWRGTGRCGTVARREHETVMRGRIFSSGLMM